MTSVFLKNIFDATNIGPLRRQDTKKK